MVDIEGFPLGHVEASANVNEKRLVNQLLEEVLCEDFEIELLVEDSQFESEKVFHLLDQKRIESLICWQ